MSAAVITVRVLRPLFVRGDRYMSGDVVGLAPIDAVTVLESGRAELVDPKDLATLKTTASAATRAALSTVRHGESPVPRGRWA